MTTHDTENTTIAYRVFYTGHDGTVKGTHRSCVRVFKAHQREEAKVFAKRYCAGSEHGAIVEVILYANHKAVNTVLAVRRK